MSSSGSRSDVFNLGMQHAGKNGMAHGNGIYMGLSDQVSVSYNRRGGDNTHKDGTAVLSPESHTVPYV